MSALGWGVAWTFILLAVSLWWALPQNLKQRRQRG
jgi:hypothetical protein